MTTWITDDNGNRASVEYWGSEESARLSLKTLNSCTSCTDCTNCTNCTDCTNCTNCTDCTSCTDCTNCIRCTNCTNCTDCSGCSGCTNCTRCTEYCIIGPTRSDGYTFFLSAAPARRIRAGCRDFANFAEAREHWTTTRGGTKLGIESLAILDALEQIAKLEDN